MKVRITEVQISDFRLNLCSSLGFILFPYHVEKKGVVYICEAFLVSNGVEPLVYKSTQSG